MSDGLVERHLVRLPSNLLRELTLVAEAHEAAENPWRLLPERAVDEALVMLLHGVIPALGWWRRNLPKADVDETWPPLPPARSTRRWQPWELVAAAIDLADDGVDIDLAQDVLAVLASRHGLTADDLADAYGVLEEPAA